MGEDKKYDLEDRTFKYANSCKEFTKGILKNIYNIEYCKQLIRSAGSVAANYIEANESLSKKDFIHRVKISRKEAKESRLWLKLIESNDKDKNNDLINESTELIKFFLLLLKKVNSLEFII